MEESIMVLESARSRLSALAPLAAELNQTTDAFTDELKTVEAKLGRLNVGVDVVLDQPLSEGDLLEDRDHRDDLQERYRFDTHLAYGKAPLPSAAPLQPAWRLLVRQYRVDVDDDGNVVRSIRVSEKPLLEASRELRIAAAGQINRLLDELTREAREKLVVLREVTDKK